MFDKVVTALVAGAAQVVTDGLWYAAAAGAVWAFFYVAFRRATRHRKVVPRDPARHQIRREVATSARSILVFGAVTGVVIFAREHGGTQLYACVDDYGWVWFFASIALAVVLHDAYFYWSHRLLHSPRLFRLVHRTHHKSTNPTPWAAYSFSTTEALVQAGIGPLVVVLIPMHAAAFTAFMAWQIGFNVLGHCGYEIFPQWFLRTWAGKFLNTPTHHALHHEKVRGNYGLYFNVWDRVLGTNHPDYQVRFERASGPGAAADGLPQEHEHEMSGVSGYMPVQTLRGAGAPERSVGTAVGPTSRMTS